jgi:hypothetical protein
MQPVAVQGTGSTAAIIGLRGDSVKNKLESERRRQWCRRQNADRRHQRIGGLMRHGISREEAEGKMVDVETEDYYPRNGQPEELAFIVG